MTSQYQHQMKKAAVAEEEGRQHALLGLPYENPYVDRSLLLAQAWRRGFQRAGVEQPTPKGDG